MAIFATIVLLGIVYASKIQGEDGNLLPGLPSKATPEPHIALISDQEIKDELYATPQQVQAEIAIISLKYSLDYDEIYNTIKCESNFTTDRYGDFGVAYGVAQFHFDTFHRFCFGSYYNWKDQLECLGQVWKTWGVPGKRNWSCWTAQYGK